MLLGEVGTILIVLIIILIFVHLWFSIVEALLKLVKNLFMPENKKNRWHKLNDKGEKE